jgi:hypothetical protein
MPFRDSKLREHAGLIAGVVVLGIATLGGVAAAGALSHTDNSESLHGAASVADRAALPEELKYELPDGSVGYIAKSDVGPASAEGIREYVAEWQRRLAPITASVDPKSEIIGYYLMNYGFVSLDVVNAPGFSVDALVAAAQQHRTDLEQQLQQNHSPVAAP